MIDVNKITSTLAKLPDQQLQQYAQMHKSDPYIMALAMSESNRRKEMRAAGQGGQGMQEQPKVVDQMVAEMAPQQLPEEMGIGQLPAGEMNFAGGGIVAFADGGDVERYQSQGLVEETSSTAGRFFGGIGDFFSRQIAESRAAQERIRAENERRRLIESVQPGLFEQLTPTELKAREALKARLSTPTPAQQQAEYIRQQDMLMKNHGPFRRPEEYEAEEASIAARAAKQAAEKAKPAVTAPRSDTTQRSLSGEPKAGTTPAAGLPGLADLTKLRQDITNAQNYQDPAAAGLLELEAQERANAAAKRQSILADAEKFKDAYKGREGRLAEREADIGKQRGTNTGLAFLNAGLAIMSTPGGLATAIGKGAQVGTAQFASGLDKIRSAQERLSDARDRLDDLKLNREDVTAKDLRDAENEYRRVAVDAQKRSIDGVRMAAGVNEKRASDIYTKTVSLAETMYKEQQANVRNRALVDSRVDTAGTKQARLQLDSLKAMATNLSNELKDPFLGSPRNAEIKKAKQAELAQINTQLAQLSGLGTMMPASPAGAGSGLDLSQWGKSQVVNQ
jgi:hypothetical protein